MSNPFVSTIISTAPVGAATAGFGVPAALSYNTSGWGAERGRLYAGYDEVLVDFPVTTGPEALWAAAVFGQSQRPPLVAILRGALPPTQVYALSGTTVTAGLTYRLTVAGKGVTTTDIAITLPAADIVVASGSIANASETWTSAAHGMTTGDGPYRVTTSNTLPTGLAVDTDYWIIAPTSGTFKLASSYANAIAVTPIDISSDGVGNQTLVRTSNDVLMALLKDRLNSVVGKNYTAVQTAGALDTDTLTITASSAGNWFAIAIGDVSLLGCVQTHVDPGVATDLAAIAVAFTGSWYALDTFYNSQAYVVAAAAWIESASPRRIYHAGTSDSLALTQVVGTGGYDVADRIKTAAYARTSVWYHPSPAAMLTGALAGRILPLNPGAVAAVHKPLTGPAAVAMTTTQRNNLLAKYGNSYSSFESGTAATFVGKTGSGEWWDVVRNDDSVNDDMRVSLYNLLYQSDIIAGDDGGITQVAGTVEAVLDRAVKARIYTAPVVTVPLFSAVSAANKAARRLPISWAATRVGAVVYIDATGTVS
jgi:hypothetical protein